VGFIESWIGKEFGPAVSTGQTPDQVGRRRPPVYTPLEGLYLAGCNAGARGVGTELAASSAMECVDRVLADLGREVPSPSLGARPRSTTESAARLIARAAARPLAWATRGLHQRPVSVFSELVDTRKVASFVVMAGFMAMNAATSKQKN